MFRQQGYAQTTTRQIAHEMGFQKGTLYHYFKNKEEILLEISEQALRSIVGAVQYATELEPSDSDVTVGSLTVIERAIAAHVINALDSLDMHAVMLVELKALDSSHRAMVVKLRRDYELLWESLIDAAIADGSLRHDIAPRHLTLALLNLLNWTIFWYRPDGALSAEQWAATVSSIFLSGAQCPSPYSTIPSLESSSTALSSADNTIAADRYGPPPTSKTAIIQE